MDFESKLQQGLQKVYRGTPIHWRESLCRTCRYAWIRQGLAESDETIVCSAAPGQDATQITSVTHLCSYYTDKRLPSLRDMREIAWVLTTDKKRNSIGFQSPVERRQQQRRSEFDDD